MRLGAIETFAGIYCSSPVGFTKMEHEGHQS